MLTDNPSLLSPGRLTLPVGLSLLLLAGCGGGADAPADGPIEAAPAEALTANSAAGCSVDRDCAKGNYCFLGQCSSACQTDADCADAESCTERGRCIGPDQTGSASSGADPAVAEARSYEGLRVVEADMTRFHVEKNQQSVTYELTLNRPTPKGGLPYRIDRSDDDEVTTTVEYIDSDGKTLAFRIPVGQASPGAEESTRVQLKIFTPLGNYTLQLIPQYPISGSYQGVASFDTFGQSGLDIDFEVITKPDGVPLRQAERAWLALPVGSEHLLSPTNPSPTAPDYVARRLTYDDFVDRWVATFEGRYDLSGGGVVRVEDADQVERSLRFEIERLDEETLVGAMNDHWRGLYEAKSVDDVADPKVVTFKAKLTVDRAGGTRSHTDLEVEPMPRADTKELPAPSIDACSKASLFDVTPVETEDNGIFSCNTIADAAGFEAAEADEQASCAMAVARRSLEGGETTISRVESYLNGQNSGSDSFADFMQKCAAHTDGLCQPTDAVRCGRQLVARAYDSQGPASNRLDLLVKQYNESTRETFFGKQVAAFYSDTSLREEWLASTNWPETFQGLKDLVGSMLEEWKTKVLEAHLGSLQGQFDPSGLNVLSRQVDNDAASEARQQLLVGLTQSWRGSIDALTLATKRWNILFQSAGKRRQKADYVAGRILDLYLSAGLLRDLNSAAGAPFLSARLAGGFDVLVDELDRLNQPFSDLIYARDGEVAISTSLDPTVDNTTLMSKRREAAIKQVEEAQTEVSTILEESRAQALNKQQIKTKWANRIDNARADLLEMCGRPVGCQDVNYLEGKPPEECEVRWQAGRCGFNVDREDGSIVAAKPGQQNTSEAGQVLLEVREAVQNIQIADAERQALTQRMSLRWAELKAFSKDIQQRNARRKQFISTLKDNVARRGQLRNKTVEQALASMEESADVHQKVIDESSRRFDSWADIETRQSNQVMEKLVKAEEQRIAARTLKFSADTANGIADIVSAALPTGWSDASSSGRMAAQATGFATSRALDASAMGLEQSAGQVDLARERLQIRQDTRMTKLKRQLKVDRAKWSARIAELRRERQKRRQLSRNQIAQLKEAIEVARQYLEADLAHKRDLAKFRKKRRKVKEMLTEVAGLDLRYQRSKLQLTQVLARYRRVVQRARNAHTQLDKLTEQHTHINSLVGSPDVIFAKANELKAAERSLFAARQKLMNWLVALEYYAVRPFLDQRMQILLARNTYQLEKIGEELQILENKCGGPTNEIDTTLSVRQDLLGITQPSKDAVTGQTLSPGERFRELLDRGYVPVDKRIRYSSDETVGALMSRSPQIMAGTFFVDLQDFANLELSCNAKVKSVAVNLVGEGLSEVRPTVTLLYDGTSKLRTCQPGLADYIDAISATATTYDTISRFNPAGRSMSPVATVNGFGSMGGQQSTTLSGLPLASQYTLLINKKAGENEELDWSKLQDIELRLQYTYQDVFPEGQCEL